MTDDETVAEAVRIITRDYYADVRSVADNLRADIAAGQIGDPEQLHDALHEAIDGHQRVIYTWQARLGLLASGNSDAYIDEYGAEGIAENGAIDWSRLMYAAMERDVFDELGDFGDLFTTSPHAIEEHLRTMTERNATDDEMRTYLLSTGMSQSEAEHTINRYVYGEDDDNA